MSLTTEQRNAAYDRAQHRTRAEGACLDDVYGQELEKLETPASASVTVCDPDPDIRCEYCGTEIVNGMTDVVLERRPTGLIVFCTCRCANADHRETMKLRAMGNEPTPF